MKVAIVATAGVNVVHWNPRAPLVRSVPLLNRIRTGPRVNNFGDLLGPRIVAAMLEGRNARGQGSKRLLTVGSILHFAGNGDTIWGTGVNGKVPTELHTFSNLDVRAVRGPKTREFLVSRGISCPEVYGDPALLLPSLRPDLVALSGARRSGQLIIPNLNDLMSSHFHVPTDTVVLDPRGPIEEILRAIVGAESVVTSSLHGLIVAEAFGVPVTLVRSRAEHAFKFEDYLEGTGRSLGRFPVAETFEQGISSKPHERQLSWTADPLLAAFPFELWDDGGLLPRKDGRAQGGRDG